MKQLKSILHVILIMYSYTSLGQLVDAEVASSKTIYTGTFYVNGDADTYYPVTFRKGEQNIINHLRVYRSHNHPGPTELSASGSNAHIAGLTLEIDVNYGGWGGAIYDWRIMDIRQSYNTVFADAKHDMNNIGFTIWLRGGGMQYKYESEKPADIIVGYDSITPIYERNGYPNHTVYASPAKTEINKENINKHLLGHSNPILTWAGGTPWGDGKLSNESGWKNGTYPTVGSNGTRGSLIMLHNPHTPFRTDNAAPGYSGRAGIRMATSENASNWWDVGLAGDFFHVFSRTGGEFLRIDNNGNVGIGTDQPDHLLTVNGTIHSKEVVIDLEGAFAPDYVFDSTYDLKSLEEVDDYIQKNNHLPNIPSAVEMEENGINLKEMNLKLLEKIEELTLHMIEMNKEIKALKAFNAKQD